MARIAGSDGAQTAEAVRQRRIAPDPRARLRRLWPARAGPRQLACSRPRSIIISPASRICLFTLINTHMDCTDRKRAKRRCTACEATTVLARLVAFCTHHMEYHIERKQRGVRGQFRAARVECRKCPVWCLSKRHRYEAMLIDILDAGRSIRPVVGAADTHVAAYATLAMLTGACTWYRPGWPAEPSRSGRICM